jgi:hypothetical protein
MRRDLDRLRFVKRQIKEIEKTRALTRVVGVGVETADMLVQEVFSSGTVRHWLDTPASPELQTVENTAPSFPGRGRHGSAPLVRFSFNNGDVTEGARSGEHRAARTYIRPTHEGRTVMQSSASAAKFRGAGPF